MEQFRDLWGQTGWTIWLGLRLSWLSCSSARVFFDCISFGLFTLFIVYHYHNLGTEEEIRLYRFSVLPCWRCVRHQCFFNLEPLCCNIRIWNRAVHHKTFGFVDNKAGVGGLNISMRILLHLSFYYHVSLRQGPPTKWRMLPASTSQQLISNFILHIVYILH